MMTSSKIHNRIREEEKAEKISKYLLPKKKSREKSTATVESPGKDRKTAKKRKPSCIDNDPPVSSAHASCSARPIVRDDETNDYSGRVDEDIVVRRSTRLPRIHRFDPPRKSAQKKKPLLAEW